MEKVNVRQRRRRGRFRVWYVKENEGGRYDVKNKKRKENNVTTDLNNQILKSAIVHVCVLIVHARVLPKFQNFPHQKKKRKIQGTFHTAVCYVHTPVCPWYFTNSFTWVSKPNRSSSVYVSSNTEYYRRGVLRSNFDSLLCLPVWWNQ